MNVMTLILAMTTLHALICWEVFLVLVKWASKEMGQIARVGWIEVVLCGVTVGQWPQ